MSKDLKNETEIICEVAKATIGERTKVDWNRYAKSYDAVRDLIEQFIPGFEQYNDRVRKPGGFYLPNAPRNGKFGTVLFGNKMPFSICRLPELKMEPDDFMMASVRSHDQFNNHLWFEDRYRGVRVKGVIFMNEKIL